MTPFALSCEWLKGAELNALLDALERVGTTRVVGGAVRDTLLGLPVHDIDLATDAVPEVVGKAAHAAGLTVHETGLTHGTLTVVSGGKPFEVTTLREDVATDGRRATVRFTKSFSRDAVRRDFTMNALYVDRHGNGIDYVGGYPDCLARRVRFIGDPAERILEDHLRILRFFRFHARFAAGPFDPEGLAACRAHKAQLATLAAERVQSELLRLLQAPGATQAIDVLAGEGFLEAFASQPLEPTSFRALVAAQAAAGRPVGPVLGLCALTGFSRAPFAALAERLKLPKKALARGLDALRASASMPPRSAAEARAMIYEHGAEAFADGLILALAQGTEIPDLTGYLALPQRWAPPRFPLSGRDLLEQGGEPGKALGERLARLERLWRDSDFCMGREALLAIDARELRGTG